MSETSPGRRAFLRRAALAASAFGAAGVIAPLIGCGRNEPTPARPPLAPLQLEALAVSATQIDLTWTDASADETSFEVERRAGDAPFATRASLAADTNSYPDSGLEPATRYDYRVRSLNAAGTSDYSTTASATTPAAEAPEAPTHLAASDPAASGVRLTWQSNSTTETHFRVETRAGVAGEFAVAALLPPATTTFEITGLSTDTRYVARVIALNAAGDSPPSNSVAVRTGAAIDTLVLSNPEPGRLLLEWHDRTAGSAAFAIERQLGEGGFEPLGLAEAGVTTFSDASLVPGAQHAYRVRSDGETSLDVPPVALDVPALPGMPIGVSALNAPDDGSRLWVSWEAGDGGPTGRYHLERRLGAATFSPVDIPGDPAILSVDDAPGLTFRSFDYRVRASNPAGFSSYSVVVSRTTRAVIQITGPLAVLNTVGKGVKTTLNGVAGNLFVPGCGFNLNTPLILARESETKMAAVVAICTHACCIPAYQESSQTLVCPCHGSKFRLDGTVINGPNGSGPDTIRPEPILATELFSDRVELLAPGDPIPEAPVQ